MPVLKVELFGKLQIQYDETRIDCLNVAKAQELLCYLLLHRAWPHPREALADLLWSDCVCVQRKKYLLRSLCPQWTTISGLLFDCVIPEK